MMELALSSMAVQCNPKTESLGSKFKTSSGRLLSYG